MNSNLTVAVGPKTPKLQIFQISIKTEIQLYQHIELDERILFHSSFEQIHCMHSSSLNNKLNHLMNIRTMNLIIVHLMSFIYFPNGHKSFLNQICKDS